MTPIDQIEINSKTGDCMRASIASILDLELQAVPHFTRMPDDLWFKVLYYFFYANNYVYSGVRKYTNQKLPLKKYSINNHYLASVKSRSYGEVGHMVVVDKNLKVVHDPNPNKKWLGEKLMNNEDFNYVYLFEKLPEEKQNIFPA